MTNSKKNPLLHPEPPDRPEAFQALFSAIIKVESSWGLFESYYQDARDLFAQTRGPGPRDWPSQVEARRKRNEQIAQWERERMRSEGEEEGSVFVPPTPWAALLEHFSDAYVAWCAAVLAAVEAVAPAMAARHEAVPVFSEEWFVDLRAELREHAGPLHPSGAGGNDGMGLIGARCPPIPAAVTDNLEKVQRRRLRLMDVRRAPAPPTFHGPSANGASQSAGSGELRIPDEWPLAEALQWTLEPLDLLVEFLTGRVLDGDEYVLDAALPDFRQMLGEARGRHVAFSAWLTRRYGPWQIWPGDLRALLNKLGAVGRLYGFAGQPGRVPKLTANLMAQGVRDAGRYLTGLGRQSGNVGPKETVVAEPEPTVDPATGRYIAPPAWSAAAAVGWYLQAVEEVEQFIFNCPPLSTGERDFSQLSDEFDRLAREVTARVGLLEPWLQESMPTAEGKALLNLVVRPHTMVYLVGSPAAAGATPYVITESAANAFGHAAAELRRRLKRTDTPGGLNKSSGPHQIASPAAAAAAGMSAVSAQQDLEELERSTPPLIKNIGMWVTNKTAAEIDGVQPRTLATYRALGIQNAAKSLGRDPDGRVWRRTGTVKSHPWYLRATLKSKQNRGPKP